MNVRRTVLSSAAALAVLAIAAPGASASGCVLTAGHVRKQHFYSAVACAPWHKDDKRAYGSTKLSVTDSVSGSDGFGSANVTAKPKGLAPGGYSLGVVVLDGGDCWGFLQPYQVTDNGQAVKVATGTSLAAGRHTVQVVVVPDGANDIHRAVLVTKPVDITVG